MIIYYNLPIEEWKRLVKYSINLELFYDTLKKQKKITKEQKFEMEKRLRKIEYFLWLTSPHLKDKPHVQKEVYLDCLRDFKEFHSRSKTISKTDSSNSAKRID